MGSCRLPTANSGGCGVWIYLDRKCRGGTSWNVVLDTAKGLGALHVLTKPFPAAELYGAIEKLLEAS